MMLNLPLNRPTPWSPASILTRFVGTAMGTAVGAAVGTARRHVLKASLRAELAPKLAATDAATGLTARRPATLWLHAAAGIAERKGESLAAAVIAAPSARPADVARAIAQAVPTGALAARWDDGTYLVVLPEPQRDACAPKLAAAFQAAGVKALVGWRVGTDPQDLVA